MIDFHLIDNHVYKIFISPNDRTLKYSFDLELTEYKIPIQLFEIIIADRAKWKKNHLAKYYLARGPETSFDLNKRKLIIIFPGRNLNFFQKSNCFYFEKFYETKKLSSFDIALIIYPQKVNSLERLSQSCALALTQILQHGYKYENVSIMGWCLGGYFATETLKCYFERTNFVNSTSKFNLFINNKSFNGLNDFLYFILPKYTRPVLKFYPVKSCVKVWDHDSAESIKKFENCFKQVYVIYTEQDNIVKGLSHLYKHLEDQDEKILIKEDTEKVTHNPNWNLIADIFTKSLIH